ncbi:hypothetical protein [Actinomadura sp. DC4]|uniref:hypothetical protein n=1 Tax=Actinomadura sp. DC4 TaxID=3055069 RepID=UPI0025B22E5D|nr:hypothetical protein [Actinomadura sp. DC4]MDN3353603.1 hypothetical protein [Actinomadura sp. DC4]
MNAEAAVDEASHEGTQRNGLVPPPPTSQQLNDMRPDEMVGLPAQLPGYPGQQRSVDTS